MADLNRLIDAMRRIIRAEFPNATFQGIYEYSIQSASSMMVDAEPVDTTLGLPSISSVPLRSSILGEEVKPTVGKLCLVMFVNGLPSRPVVVSCAASNETVSVDATTQVSLAGGGPAAARFGDTILAGGFLAGTITSGSTKTVIG